MKLTAFATWLQRLWMALALFAGLAAPIAAMAEDSSSGAGKGRFVFSGWDGPPLPVWYQLPENVAADTPVVVVMHGVNRDADRYRDEWAELALAHRFIVIVPEYSRADFPGSDGYNTGFFTGADGTPRPRGLWSFAAIEPLFDEVRRRFGTAAPRYTLYGHSAGAQFVHRYVLFMPEARIEQAIAANAGWYTMPDPAISFPYGVQGAPVTGETLKAALAKPLTILLGTADIDTNDPDLRTTAEANRQGPHRLARGQSFLAEGQALAGRLGTPLGWKVEFVPGVGHKNGLMAQAAARLIAARAAGDAGRVLAIHPD
jgi:poly(3-hydroxybutyrate) depolymerase